MQPNATYDEDVIKECLVCIRSRLLCLQIARPEKSNQKSLQIQDKTYLCFSDSQKACSNSIEVTRTQLNDNDYYVAFRINAPITSLTILYTAKDQSDVTATLGLREVPYPCEYLLSYELPCLKKKQPQQS